MEESEGNKRQGLGGASCDITCWLVRKVQCLPCRPACKQHDESRMRTIPPRDEYLTLMMNAIDSNNPLNASKTCWCITWGSLECRATSCTARSRILYPRSPPLLCLCRQPQHPQRDQSLITDSLPRTDSSSIIVSRSKKNHSHDTLTQNELLGDVFHQSKPACHVRETKTMVSKMKSR